MRAVRILETLGEGGLGRTVRAEWVQGGEPFALKILTRASAGRCALLRREFHALRGLGHPNLVRALDYGPFAVDAAEIAHADPGERQPIMGMALELVAGVPLSIHGGTWADVASPLADALEALEAVHAQGFLHGDVKPDNIVVRHDGTGVLLDLSAASPLGTAPTGERTGTAWYLAPEAGLVPASTRLDLFAVGRTLETLARRVLGQPTPVSRWMHAALSSEAAARPAGLDDLLDALRGPTRRTAREPFVARLVGRRGLLDTVERAALDPSGPRLVALLGPPGSGRARLLGELRWALVDRADVHVVGPDDGMAQLLSWIECPARPVVLLARDPARAIRARLETLAADGAATVVLATTMAPQAAHVAVEVPPLTLAEAHELLPASFPTVLVARAHRASGGWPGPLVKLAYAAATMRPTAAAVDRIVAGDHEASRCAARPDAVDHARKLRLAGQSERAASVLAVALRRGVGERAALRIEAAACQLAAGQTPRARHTLARIGPLEGLPEALRARCTDVHAELALKTGTYARAAELSQRTATSEPDVAWSLAITAAAALSLLDAPQADAAMAKARSLAPTPAPPRLHYRLQSAEALRLHRRGNTREAQRAYGAAAALVEREGLDDLRATATYNVATAAEQAGQIGAALDTYERTVLLARLTGAASTEMRARFALANLLLELGQRERARAHAREARQGAERAGLGLLTALTLAIEGEAAQQPHVVAEAQRVLPAAARESAEALEIALTHARLHAPTTARLGELLRWAERLDASDFCTRVLVLWPVADASAPRLEEVLARVLASGSPFRALDLHEHLHAVYTHQGATLHAEEHARAAVYLAETLQADLPAALRAPLDLRALRLRAPAPTAGPPEASAPWPEEVARLFDVQRRLSGTTSVDELLGAALDCAIVLAGAERGFVVLATGATFDVRAARNLDAAKLSGRELSFSRSIVREVLATREPRFAVRATGTVNEFLQRQRSVHAQKLRAVVALPFVTERGVEGALYLDNRFVATSPSARAREVLLFLRDQIAGALDRALLVAELADRNRELERQRAELEKLLHEERAELARRSEAARKLGSARATVGKFADIVGQSEPMLRALALLERVAQADVTVLVEGESGTGKELFARALHDESARKNAPFVAINCGALPETLLEAELFGARRGAFTGAVKDTRGLLLAAQGGTLFLDEIGEMPLAMQVKLLRVLQEREVRALGSEQATPIDLRVVGATHRNLEEEVRQGRFREDLFFRLAVVRIVVPPLRERGADVIAIADAVLDRAAVTLGLPRRELGPSARRALLAHRFPGNVRELENVLTKALVLSGKTAPGAPLEAEDLGLPPAAWARSRRTPADLERKGLVEALEATGGNVVNAAKRLGMPRATFYRKLARHGLRRK